MSAVSSRISRVCAGFHSAPVSRSLINMIGAGAVVVISIFYLPCSGVGYERRAAVAGAARGRVLEDRYENGLHQTEKLAHLRFSDNERRKKAQSVIVRAVDEESLFRGFGDERATFNGKFHADHEAFAADFFDEIEFGRKFRKAFEKVSAAGANVLEEFFVFDDIQEFERGGADERPAAESSAVEARRDARGDGFGGENRTERQPCREWLGDYDDIGSGGKFLVTEIAACAAEAALNFVG